MTEQQKPPAHRDSKRPIDAAGFRESVRQGWGPVTRTVTVPPGLA